MAGFAANLSRESCAVAFGRSTAVHLFLLLQPIALDDDSGLRRGRCRVRLADGEGSRNLRRAVLTKVSADVDVVEVQGGTLLDARDVGQPARGGSSLSDSVVYGHERGIPVDLVARPYSVGCASLLLVVRRGGEGPNHHDDHYCQVGLRRG